MPLSEYRRPQDARVFPARGRRVSLIVYARHLGSLAGIIWSPAQVSDNPWRFGLVWGLEPLALEGWDPPSQSKAPIREA